MQCAATAGYCHSCPVPTAAPRVTLCARPRPWPAWAGRLPAGAALPQVVSVKGAPASLVCMSDPEALAMEAWLGDASAPAESALSSNSITPVQLCLIGPSDVTEVACQAPRFLPHLTELDLSGLGNGHSEVKNLIDSLREMQQHTSAQQGPGGQGAASRS